MKSKITFLFIFIILVFNTVNAQAPNFIPDGGEFVFNPNNVPCITDEERKAVLNEIRNSIQQLKSEKKLSYKGKSNKISHPLFIWPVKKKDGLEYNDVWGISNYVDQNSAFPNQILDYNCGNRTYDVDNGYNHAGIDIFSWPFQWKMMDNDEVEIIAAAPGQILAKIDSRIDRSCSLNGTNWNFIYIQHDDGSVAVYGHMKQNSATTKNVGDVVTEGEYLGIVGSSGNSTGPHLHFEVYSEIEWNGVGQDVLVDPYAGACNNMNTDTWWQDQKPYNNPRINAALTHTAPPVFPACPTQETTNESNDFNSNDLIYFAIYVRDQTANDVISLEIIRPDNTSLFSNWSFPVQTTATTWYYYWSFSGYFSMEGEWKWKATFNGETVTHSFNVTSGLSVEDNYLKDTSIFPNPTDDVIHISTVKKIIKAEIVSVTGKTIQSFNNPNQGLKTINTSNLSNGLYFLRLEGDTYQRKTIKFIKQ